jgi:site-specific DNA recombinase
MTSAAIYARVSSARQKKDQTIASQTAALRDHAAALHLEVPEEWVFEDEGHSGATLVRPALERLRDLVAGACVDVVLVYSPDRLARKFAYQALLIEEFARAGTRVEFVNGPRGDSPEDQLLVQFQGMFAEYEKAQLMERYRRGKTYRARSGSVNVLSGAPFGYRFVRKTPEHGARYEIVEHEAAIVAELFRRYADDGASIAELTRWLTASGTPTRTGKTRWDRSVVWGMLRNPAYAGTAVFGKTKILHESPGLNRRARLQGRTTPRAVKTVDRPRDEWVHIPVPAVISQDTFERVARRLEDNKRFASRNAKVPSLLQGLAACSACGYGYYRTNTTTSSGKKIYYYRCLGSDDYRYEGGRVCANKPVRADYLDAVVWDHITALLADPALIRGEIDKRLERARTADPAVRQRKRLELALAKAAASITRMIEAFQEQLITIDELRTRMPDLRAREANLRGQLDAIDAQLADRDAYLKLADDLEGFLTQLRGNAENADVPQQQRVLRLLVKDVLIGPEKITIRHRIPIRERTAGNNREHDTNDTEGDMRPSYPLRWGRDQPFADERGSPRAGGSRRSSLPLRPSRGGGLSDRGEICRRPDGVLLLPAAGRAGQGTACRMAGSQGAGLQRGQDTYRPPRRRLRLPGIQHPLLPECREAAHQTKRGCGQAIAETARRRDTYASRLERGGRYRQAQPDHPRVGRLLPWGGVQQGLLGAGPLPVAAHLPVGAPQTPQQVEEVGRQTLLRHIQQVQKRPVGVRRPIHGRRTRRRPPYDQVLLDRHRPAPARHRRSVPRRPRPDRVLGQTTAEGPIPAGQLPPTPARHAGRPLPALQGTPPGRRTVTTIPASVGTMVAQCRAKSDSRQLPRP